MKTRIRRTVGWRMATLVALAAFWGNLPDRLPYPISSAPRLGGVALAADIKAHGPDLGVTMLRAGDDPRGLITPGQTITLSIGVDNLRGDAAARSSALIVTLPAGLALKQARPAPGRTAATGGGANLTWNLGTVEAGAFPRIFELDLTPAGNPRPNTALTVSTTVGTADREANQKNNHGAFSFAVEPAVADLAVASNLAAVPLTVGGPVKFSASVSNWGTAVASATTLTLTLPARVSFKTGDPPPATAAAGSASWKLGDLEPAGTRVVAITIATDARLAVSVFQGSPSQLRFKLDASTATSDVNPANNHLEIDRRLETGGVDLKVWLSVQGAGEPGELPPGKDVTYTIRYGNFGIQPAKNASLSLSLWLGLSLVQAQPQPSRLSKSDRFGGGVVSWEVGDLAVGQEAAITCRVHVASVPAEGSLVLAALSSSGGGPGATASAQSLRYAETRAKPGGHRSPVNRIIRLLLWMIVLGLALWVGLGFMTRRAPG